MKNEKMKRKEREKGTSYIIKSNMLIRLDGAMTFQNDQWVGWGHRATGQPGL